MKQFFTLFLILLTFGAINAQTTILSEDFENGLPDGWTADNYWEFGNSSAISSQYFTIPDHTNFAGFNDDDLGTTVASGKIVTSGIALDSFSAAILVFDAFFFNGDYDADETAKVLASNDGGTTWDEVVDIGGAGDWQSIEVGLVEYVGDTVWLAFEYNDGGGWNYGLGVDNILVYEPIARDIKLTSVTTKRYHEVNSDVVITGVIVNRGAETLNSFDLSWSDGVNTYTDSLVDLSISPLGTYEFSHSSTKNLVEAIQYGVEVWTSNPNGTDDLMLENDTTSTVLNGVSYIPAKKVVGEEGTGTWCGWCPRGTVAMDYMGETYENFIGIAVHNEDPMAVAEYDAGITAFPDFPGFPSALIDRVEIIDPGDLEIYYSTYIERVSPVAPSVDTAVFEVYSGDLVVDVSTEFVTKMEDIDFNVAVVITEDNVVGTSSDWDQSNYYSGGGNGEMGGFENLPDPVPADQMVYNHVARTILDSYEGVSGIVPDTVVAGNTIAESFHYSVPSDQDPANMHAIVMLIDNRTGEVLNADSKKVEVLCPDDLEITAEITPDTTNTEEAEGSITLDIGLDLEPYTYEWSNGSTESSLFGITDGTYTVTVTTKYGCTQTVEFTVETLTDVADIRGLNHISLTPNPATDQALLDVQFSQPVNMKVQLVNAIGQVLIEEQGVKISGDQYRFDLSNFANGVYLVRLLVDGQVHTERLVIGR